MARPEIGDMVFSDVPSITSDIVNAESPTSANITFDNDTSDEEHEVDDQDHESEGLEPEIEKELQEVKANINAYRAANRHIKAEARHRLQVSPHWPAMDISTADVKSGLAKIFFTADAVNQTRESDKWTCLHSAVQCSASSNVKHMLLSGANTAAIDNDGRTAWDLALERNMENDTVYSPRDERWHRVAALRVVDGFLDAEVNVQGDNKITVSINDDQPHALSSPLDRNLGHAWVSLERQNVRRPESIDGTQSTEFPS